MSRTTRTGRRPPVNVARNTSNVSHYVQAPQEVNNNPAPVEDANADHNSIYLNVETEESVNNASDAQANEVEAEPVVETERDMPAPVESLGVVDLTLQSVTPTGKKRCFSSKSTPHSSSNDTDEDGLICPVCLDAWELSGPHRIVSLKCGHLFGESCIHRWFSESMRQSGKRVCPQCKTKANNRDIRYLYARRLRAIDRSEEHSLREKLKEETNKYNALRSEFLSLKYTYNASANQIQNLEAENQRLRSMLNNKSAYQDKSTERLDLLRYKVFMKTNIELARQPGCRVMIFNKTKCTLLASKICSESLFSGYGLGFINFETFMSDTFMHTSGKFVRDICLSADQQQVAVTSMEPYAKLFDLRTKQEISSYNAHDKLLWACDMDLHERENFFYFGAQNGSTFIFDKRFPSVIVEEFSIEGDLSPVVNVASISASKLFPEGGFLVCKLQSLWFFEYSTSNNTAIPTRLHIDGPFIAMRYDKDRETILVSTRSSAHFTFARFIYGTLAKFDNTTVFDVAAVFYNSKTTPIMSRAAQITVKDNTLIAGYMQDEKRLTLHDVQRKEKVESMLVSNVIYDICPAYTANSTYFAALTDTKCRVYNLTPA